MGLADHVTNTLLPLRQRSGPDTPFAATHRIRPDLDAPGLPPLPHRIYFVIRDHASWQHLYDTDALPPSADELAGRFVVGKDMWIVQTYLHLRRRGLDVRLVGRFVPGAINVVDYDDVGRSNLSWSSYVVVCRHDRGRPMICDQRIVQNTCHLVDETDNFVRFWPQPGIIPRDSARGDHVETILYRGADKYLRGPMSDPTLPERLRALGVRIDTGRKDPTQRHMDWMDYSTGDIVLALRDCTLYDAQGKPASKLINAWLAGCPALLGPEPAYDELKQSDLDFITVRSVEDIVSAVALLRADSRLYKAMRENGLRRAQEFTTERIAAQWRDLLAGPITEGFERWRRMPWGAGHVVRPIQYALRCHAHQREKKIFYDNIRRGPRLLG